MQLWEQADLLGSPDAALNLAVMYSQGLYPGKAADQVSSTLKHLLPYQHSHSWCLNQDGNNLSSPQYMAYKYYQKSAERGHIRGAIQLSDIWTTGIPGLVNRRPLDAVLLATYLFVLLHIQYMMYPDIVTIMSY